MAWVRCIPIFCILELKFTIFSCRGDRHGIFIDDNEGNGAASDDADSSSVSSSRKTSMESVSSVMSDAVMTDVTCQQPEMSSKNCSDSTAAVVAAAAALPSALTATSTPTAEGNNNSLPKEVSYAELELLKKLEEQNR